MDKELREAAREYSRLVDAWNATAQAPEADRNWRSAAAFSLKEQALKRLGQVARAFAQGGG